MSTHLRLTLHLMFSLLAEDGITFGNRFYTNSNIKYPTKTVHSWGVFGSSKHSLLGGINRILLVPNGEGITFSDIMVAENERLTDDPLVVFRDAFELDVVGSVSDETIQKLDPPKFSSFYDQVTTLRKVFCYGENDCTHFTIPAHHYHAIWVTHKGIIQITSWDYNDPFVIGTLSTGEEVTNFADELSAEARREITIVEELEKWKPLKNLD